MQSATFLDGLRGGHLHVAFDLDLEVIGVLAGFGEDGLGLFLRFLHDAFGFGLGLEEEGFSVLFSLGETLVIEFLGEFLEFVHIVNQCFVFPTCGFLLSTNIRKKRPQPKVAARKMLSLHSKKR